MRYDLLLAELRNAPCQELRSDDEEYFELVVKIADLPKVNQILETFFGKPLKPAGAKPSAEDKKMTNEYGGIREDQTLYHLASEELYYYSLIWPWANGQSVTVKVFRAT